MKKMRALLSGYYGKGNGGDEALLATLLQMLPLDVTPVVLSGNPEETRQRYAVESYDRMAAGEVLQALRSCDAFIWGGGSLMQDITSPISPLYYGGLIILAQTMGLKTVAWSQGIGPLLYPQTRWLTKRSFQGCTGVSVRDRISSALLADWKVPHVLAPDPVWALSAKPVAQIQDLPKPRIAVTLRSHPQLTPERLSTLTHALEKLQKTTKAFILFIPFQMSQDYQIAMKMQSAFPDVSQILLLEDPQLLKGAFMGVDMAIGMRLHSLIMAFASGCRCFALSYDPKINRLMEELAIPGWDLADLPVENGVNIISQTWIEHYQNGQPASLAQIQNLLDRALLHCEVLKVALNPT